MMLLVFCDIFIFRSAQSGRVKKAQGHHWVHLSPSLVLFPAGLGIVRTQRVAHTHLLYPHFIPQQELVAQMGPYRDQSSEEWDPGQVRV